MSTNSRSYMRYYQRKRRQPYRRLTILDKLVSMGFIDSVYPINVKWPRPLMIHHPYKLFCVWGYNPRRTMIGTLNLRGLSYQNKNILLDMVATFPKYVIFVP